MADLGELLAKQNVQMADFFAQDCQCHHCWEEWKKGKEGIIIRPFIVCSECGNKRCPKATHHDNACTNSNEPGQAGSIYA
jgi:hypothetical protein